MVASGAQVRGYGWSSPAIALLRLTRLVLVDMHDKWQASGRRYLSESSMALLYPDRDIGNVAELNGGD